MATSPDRQQALRRRHKHERQAVIFGSLVAALAIAGLGGAAVYTEVLSVPFLDRGFSSPPAEEVAEVAAAPCPPEGTLPVAYNAVQVNVLNGSSRTGLAGSTATALAARGFLVLTTDDYPVDITPAAQINFGQAGIAAAYSLASNIEQAVMVLDLREDATVDLVLGRDFTQLVDPASIVLDPAAPIPAPEGCVPLEEALTVAAPAPVVTPAPGTEDTGEEQVDGGEGFQDGAPPPEG
jgi:hypothetical protein